MAVKSEEAINVSGLETTITRVLLKAQVAASKEEQS